MPLTQSPKPLRDVLYAFSLDERELNADLLDEFVRHYPEHAEELTEFAIELAVDVLQGDAAVESAEEAIDPSKQSAMVSRAISRFHNRLYTTKRATAASTTRTITETAALANPIACLDRAGVRAFAEQLHANNAFVLKLRDRQIDPETIPERFVRRVAELLKVPLEAMKAHFRGPASVQARMQYYKSDCKPEVAPRQTFEEAVRSSGLSDDQQRHLLSL